MEWLISSPIAHRGLHEPGVVYLENSINAFEHAISNSYAIELDIQLTQDNTVVVFHDEDLFRMCGLETKVNSLRKNQLPLAKLGQSGMHIPTLQEVLNIVNGRVPLLIEIKHWVKVNDDLHVILNCLLPYKGHFAIQSFNPFILNWFYKNAPHILRGQLSSNFEGEPMNIFKKYLLSECKLNFLSKPNFLSYEINALHRKTWIKRKRKNGMPILGWTVANYDQYLQVKKLNLCDNIIFEGFKP